MHNLVGNFVVGDISKALDKSKLVKKKVSVRTKTGKVIQQDRWVRPDKGETEKTKKVRYPRINYKITGEPTTYEGVRIDVIMSAWNIQGIKYDKQKWLDIRYNDLNAYKKQGIITESQKDSLMKEYSSALDKYNNKYKKDIPRIYEDVLVHLAVRARQVSKFDLDRSEFIDDTKELVEGYFYNGVINKKQRDNLLEGNTIENMIKEQVRVKRSSRRR